jgi:5'-3' exonuclease
MTKRTFILNDGANLFHRQINMTNPAQGIDSMVGMAFHLILQSMKKEFQKWNGTHAVFFLEGRSWRKDIYTDYKASRKVEQAKKTPQEQEDFKVLMEAFNDFCGYLNEKTNITVLRNPSAEADDMISVFIESHPDDIHILISSDSDFYQLLRYPGVVIYDPVKNILIKRDGIFNDNGKRISFHVDSNAKIKVGKEDESHIVDDDWYEYALFLKCIRGDKTDYIFSAYPGVRENGTKKQIGIKEAYSDITTKGYSWNNFMNQKWIDHNQVSYMVKDKYEFNRKLIDLKEIPEDVKNDCLRIIAEEVDRKNVPAVEIGVHFLKFCGKWDLVKISNSSAAFMPMLKSKYS